MSRDCSDVALGLQASKYWPRPHIIESLFDDKGKLRFVWHCLLISVNCVRSRHINLLYRIDSACSCLWGRLVTN